MESLAQGIHCSCCILVRAHALRACTDRHQVLSPILLKGRLDEPFYSEWLSLVKAITAVTDFTIPKSNLPTLRSRFVRFIKHYEAHYYKHKHHRLVACKAVFHALLHM